MKRQVLFFENERKFDLVVRLNKDARDQVDLSQLFIHLPNNASIPLSEVASIEYKEGPMQISRESARRTIGIGINVRNRDIASLVEEIQMTLDEKLIMPAGYSITYGGQFENLQEAQRRLGIAVPAALLLIFVLLYFYFWKNQICAYHFHGCTISSDRRCAGPLVTGHAI